MKVKAGKQIVDAISLAYAASRPVLLEGAHGIGKSQLIEQAAQQLGIRCIVRDLSLMEPPDLIGLPSIADGRTSYAPPSFLPKRGKGLLVFEELNRSEKYMMAPCLQLLTARTLNDYNLPKGWLPVAAINPASDGYDVSELDPALASRFVRIELTPDVVEWLAWAEGNDIHQAVIRYVRNTSDIFEVSHSNPRAWAYVSDVLKAHEKQRARSESILPITVSGLVGDVHTAAFLRTYSNAESPLAATAILGDYRRYRKEVRKWVKSKRTDLLSSSAHNVMVALQDCDLCNEMADDEEQQKRLEDFICDLPADIGRKLKQAARKNGAMA